MKDEIQNALLCLQSEIRNKVNAPEKLLQQLKQLYPAPYRLDLSWQFVNLNMATVNHFLYENRLTH